MLEQVHKIERNLDAEIKRRADADKQLQLAVETELKTMHDRLTLHIRESQMSL